MTTLEFNEFSNELLTLLLSIDNEYGQSDFEDLRRSALIAFMTAFPVPAAYAVVGELAKKRTHSLGRRLQLIAAIGYAASDLSELPKPEKTEVTLIEAHTRRWGRARTKITRVSAVNRFRDCGPKYFYGILGGVDIDKICLEEDGLEAAQTLITLAVVVEACGVSVSEHDQMCRDLLQVVTALMMVRAPNARHALLFAAACAIREMRNYRPDDVMLGFLEETLQRDPDQMCRNLAISIAGLLEDRREEDLQKLMPGSGE
jgi:hypothetical protein